MAGKVKQAYIDEYKKLENRIKYYTKQGYEFRGELPDKMSRPTKKSIEKLKEFKGAKLQAKLYKPGESESLNTQKVKISLQKYQARKQKRAEKRKAERDAAGHITDIKSIPDWIKSQGLSGDNEATIPDIVFTDFALLARRIDDLITSKHEWEDWYTNAKHIRELYFAFLKLSMELASADQDTQINAAEISKRATEAIDQIENLENHYMASYEADDLISEVNSILGLF